MRQFCGSVFGFKSMGVYVPNKDIYVVGLSNSDPFNSPPDTVRVNIINETNKDDFALGYFRLTEFDKLNYVIK